MNAWTITGTGTAAGRLPELVDRAGWEAQRGPRAESDRLGLGRPAPADPDSARLHPLEQPDRLEEVEVATLLEEPTRERAVMQRAGRPAAELARLGRCRRRYRLRRAAPPPA